MAKAPSFSFYSADFLIGTQFMSPAEVGHYIRALCRQHQDGHLTPEDFESIAGGPVPPKVLKKFSRDEHGNFFNERLRAEMEKRSAFIEKQRGHGAKRWQNHNPSHPLPTPEPLGSAEASLKVASGLAMPLENSKQKTEIVDSSLGISKPIEGETDKARRADLGGKRDSEIANFLASDSLTVRSRKAWMALWSVWTGYKASQFRFRYKSTNSELQALKSLVMASGGNYDQAEALVHRSIANGYSGLIFSNDKKQNNGTTQNTPPRSSNPGTSAARVAGLKNF